MRHGLKLRSAYAEFSQLNAIATPVEVTPPKLGTYKAVRTGFWPWLAGPREDTLKCFRGFYLKAWAKIRSWLPYV